MLVKCCTQRGAKWTRPVAGRYQHNRLYKDRDCYTRSFLIFVSCLLGLRTSVSFSVLMIRHRQIHAAIFHAVITKTLSISNPSSLGSIIPKRLETGIISSLSKYSIQLGMILRLYVKPAKRLTPTTRRGQKEVRNLCWQNNNWGKRAFPLPVR